MLLDSTCYPWKQSSVNLPQFRFRLQRITRADDRHLKLPLYVQAAIPWIWMVDPEARLVEVYVPDGGQPKLVRSGAGGEILTLPPFDLETSLEPWWTDRDAL